MYTSKTFLWTIGSLCLVGVASGAQAYAAPEPAALDRGRACIAVRFDGAPVPGPDRTRHLGHVGWVIEVAHGRFMFGGVEGPPAGLGQLFSPGGQPNGGWYSWGTWEEALEALRNPHLRNSNPAHAGGRYDAIKCTEVARPRIEPGETSGRTMPGRGYAVVKNNCLDAADGVVRAYGTAGLPRPSDTLAPNLYFAHLPWQETHL